jgi:predicted Mrr-cat superfamily restriction endonuclease
MAFWVVRAGKHGVNEDYTVESNAVVIGWEKVGDLSAISTKEAMVKTRAGGTTRTNHLLPLPNVMGRNHSAIPYT